MRKITVYGLEDNCSRGWVLFFWVFGLEGGRGVCLYGIPEVGVEGWKSPLSLQLECIKKPAVQPGESKH